MRGADLGVAATSAVIVAELFDRAVEAPITFPG